MAIYFYFNMFTYTCIFKLNCISNIPLITTSTDTIIQNTVIILKTILTLSNMTIQEMHFKRIILLITIRTISLRTNDGVIIFAISKRAHFIFTEICLNKLIYPYQITR